MSESDRRCLDQILAFSMNRKQAGDVIDRNLLPHAAQCAFALGPGRDSELSIMMDRLQPNAC